MEDAWQAALLDTVISGGFDNYAKLAHQYLNLFVLILDSEFRHLAHCPDRSHEDLFWTEFMTHGKLSFSMIQLMNDRGILYGGLRQKSTYVPSTEEWGLEYQRIVGNIFLNGDYVGSITAMCDSKEDITEDRLKFFEILRKALSVEFQRQNLAAKHVHDSFSFFLTRLLEGNGKELSECLPNAPGNCMRGDYALLSLRPRNVDAAKEGERMLSITRKSIDDAMQGLRSVIFGDNIYILLTRVAGIIHLHKRIAEILRALGDHSLNLCMGISNIFSDLRDIRDHKEQADYALEICNTGEDISHKFYINCVITRIKEIVSKNIPAKSFIHPSVNLLREYDAKNNTNYTETLLSYVTSGGNVKKCVHELHIHRNTLIYRLKVIENLTDLNLQDAETVALLGMNFYLSG